VFSGVIEIFLGTSVNAHLMIKRDPKECFLYQLLFSKGIHLALGNTKLRDLDGRVFTESIPIKIESVGTVPATKHGSNNSHSEVL
jgi:hypothetical protein